MMDRGRIGANHYVVARPSIHLTSRGVSANDNHRCHWTFCQSQPDYEARLVHLSVDNPVHNLWKLCEYNFVYNCKPMA